MQYAARCVTISLFIFMNLMRYLDEDNSALQHMPVQAAAMSEMLHSPLA